MNLADLTLLRPWWLLALLPAGLLLWRLGRALGGGLEAWRQAVDPHLAPHVLTGAAGRGRKMGLALLGVGFLGAIVALAGPGFGRSEGAYRPDLARVVAVDLSAAWAAADGDASRLERAKLKLLDLLSILPPGQTALLVYAGEPYLVAPPSTDTETLARFVPELAVDAVPAAGNRPGLALTMAARLLARSGSREREILWITAGAEVAGLPMAELEDVRFSILHAAPADDSALAALARKGGVYARMGADDGDIRRLAAAPAAGSVFDGGRGGGIADRGYWLLLPLLALGALAFRRGLLAVLVAPLLLSGFLAPPPVLALEGLPQGYLADYRAWLRLRSGDAEGAAGSFADRRWRAAASYRAGRFEDAAALLEGERDPDSLYNRGNALARQGKLPEALAVYEASLKLREDADARHNRDLVESLLKQGGGRQGGGKPPPPPPGNPAPGRDGDAESEARRLEEQWLRKVPDEPGTLLRRKLEAEHRRRQAAESRPW
jgi:Ca-activated chloride channel family protein